MQDRDALHDRTRRDVMREAACVSAAWAAWSAAGVVPMAAVAAGPPQMHARSLLVNDLGAPIRAAQLKVGEPQLFNYPFVATPVFLLKLDRPVTAGAELMTEAKEAYAAPAGVGPQRSIVAFSAICAHKLMYPTPQISFIGLRKGVAGEPSEVIHCCGDQSRYDPAAGARVIGGPAPQPLAAVLLSWDGKTDQLHAVGTQGGTMFEAFFEKYAFRLDMELGRRAREKTGDKAVTRPAAEYSRQWQRCSV